MSSVASIKLNGFAELGKVMERLPADIAKKVSVDALRAGAKPMLEHAQLIVPEGRTGILGKSLEIATKKATGNTAVVKVQASRKKGGYHAHLVELGTKPHEIRNVVIGGKFYPVVHHQGSKKKPFLRPAFESKKAETLKIILEQVGDKIAKRIKQALKK